MSAPPHSRSGCLVGHNDHDLLDRVNADLRGHFKIGHAIFQPEWR